MMSKSSAEFEGRLRQLGRMLINQEAARVIVSPNRSASGFWFGGGNMVEMDDGFAVIGRFRNAGDSRTGLKAGERGLELAIFTSSDGREFNKRWSWTKAQLNVGEREVLSIEGACLFRTPNLWELYVSTEKSNIGYPSPFESFLKPGTGVWTIERLAAPTLETLCDARPETVVESPEPQWIHVKDPFVHCNVAGDLTLGFCTHPFNWSSSNTAYMVRPAGSDQWDAPRYGFFARGMTWDVAMTRTTAMVDVPPVGVCQGRELSLLFYDGGESLRDLDEHSDAVARPRGYSCEELGGLAYIEAGNLEKPIRLSRYQPEFLSPHGTGCSRYVDVLTTEQGMYATWQQSQPDKSQPLVMNFLPMGEIVSILEG